MPEKTAEELAADQAAEYGEYVAIDPIDIGGARAFNVGDPVPRGHVADGLVPDESVARRTTKAAKAATSPESTKES